MRIEHFDFELPPELIAQEPVRPRDLARMLVVPRTGPFEEACVLDLPRYLQPGDLLVVNDTRVLPARLLARRGAARIELTLVRPLDSRRWTALAKNARRLRRGDVLEIAPDFTATVESREGGEVVLAFSLAGAELLEAIHRHGAMPLPPYIRRPEPRESDRIDYQTVFAEREGSIAAPTAGLHFTERLLQALHDRGVRIARVTLHVGIGTFAPVRTADLREHRMHAEWYEVPEATAAAIRETRAAGRQVVAVGTTVVRTLESVAREDGTVEPGSGETGLYILPGFRFRVVDRLLSNFHLPRSTLFALVCAFAGWRRMHEAYRHAIGRRFRFFSYGDATLLERQDDSDLPPGDP